MGSLVKLCLGGAIRCRSVNDCSDFTATSSHFEPKFQLFVAKTGISRKPSDLPNICNIAPLNGESRAVATNQRVTDRSH